MPIPWRLSSGVFYPGGWSWSPVKAWMGSVNRRRPSSGRDAGRPAPGSGHPARSGRGVSPGHPDWGPLPLRCHRPAGSSHGERRVPHRGRRPLHRGAHRAGGSVSLGNGDGPPGRHRHARDPGSGPERRVLARPTARQAMDRRRPTRRRATAGAAGRRCRGASAGVPRWRAPGASLAQWAPPAGGTPRARSRASRAADRVVPRIAGWALPVGRRTPWPGRAGSAATRFGSGRPGKGFWRRPLRDSGANRGSAARGSRTRPQPPTGAGIPVNPARAIGRPHRRPIRESPMSSPEVAATPTTTDQWVK